MLLSVIIPTYNRKKLLIDTLHSLGKQTLPCDQYDVIVVDDGSTEDVVEITQLVFPFKLHYLKQENQGDAAARNSGALYSQADLLVFIDDDIVVAEGYLAAMLEAHSQSEKLVVMGTTILWTEEDSSLFQRLSMEIRIPDGHPRSHFTMLCSNNMSIWREDYFKIGLMENLGFSGSSLWCDVDFAYRAYQMGYEFSRAPKAIGYNRDYVTESLHNASQRGYEMGYRAVVLFQKHPDLVKYIPMFHDKRTILWESDSPGLIVRKVARHPASSRPVLSTMEQLVRLLEKTFPSPSILEPLYRWIIGGYIFRGYREGLREFGHDDV